MKTKSYLFVTFILCLISSISNAQGAIEQELQMLSSDNYSPNHPYERHKPNKFDEKNNFFSTQNEYISLAIPVTTEDARLKVDRVFNISNRRFLGNYINGILVILDGLGGTETPEQPIKKMLKCKIPFSNIQGDALNKGKLSQHTKLVVWVIHDDDIGINTEPGQYLLKEIRKYFKKYAKNYSFKVPTSISFKSDQKDFGIEGFSLEDYFQPRESGGDVIGGN